MAAGYRNATVPTPRERGFTYIGALILVAIVALTSVASLQVGTLMQRRAAEEDLLAIGTEFRNAFISYAAMTPPGKLRTPATLEDLVKDTRFPTVQRHLRRIYADPITRNSSWGLVTAPLGKGVMGVYSLGSGAPIKTGNFALVFDDFKNAASYGQWQFLPPPNVIDPPGGDVRRRQDPTILK